MAEAENASGDKSLQELLKCNDYKPCDSLGYLYSTWRMVLISLSETY